MDFNPLFIHDCDMFEPTRKEEGRMLYSLFVRARLLYSLFVVRILQPVKHVLL